MNKLKESYLQLKDFCEIKTGKLDANAMVENGEYPFFTCDPTPSRIDHYAYDCECVLIGGNNANGNFPISYYNGKFNAYQRTYIITVKPNSLIPLKYILYLLKKEIMALKKRSAGSLTKFLTMGSLESIRIPLLNEEEYVHIGDNIFFYENVIKRNGDFIQNLEEYAQLLFRKWFVNFNFPDENDNPYKDSGGEMIEVDGKVIPRGWDSIKFNELFTFEKGVIPNEVIDVNDGTKYPYLTIEFLEESKGKFVEESPKLLRTKDLDILMVMDGSRSGKVFTAIDGYVGSTLAKIVPIEENIRDIGFMFLKMREKAISSRTTGSTVPHTSKNYVNSLILNLPKDTNELKKIGEKFILLRKKILQLQKENAVLSETRDLLIKKLIK